MKELDPSTESIHPLDEKENDTATKKRPYKKPELKHLGNIQNITLDSTGSLTDGDTEQVG